MNFDSKERGFAIEVEPITNLSDVRKLSDEERIDLSEVVKKFAFGTNDYYLSRIDWDDPNDPGYQTFVKLIDFYNKGLISPERITTPNPHPAFWAGQAVFHQSWQGGLAIANNPEKSQIAPNADYLILPEQHTTWSLPGGLGISTYTDFPKVLITFYFHTSSCLFALSIW